MKQGKEKGLANAYYCCAIPNLINWICVQKLAYSTNITQDISILF